MRRLRTLAACAAGAGLGVLIVSGFATADEPVKDQASTSVSGRHCVDGSQLSRRMVIDKSHVLIEDSSGRAAILKLTAPCQNLDDLDKIGFEFDGTTQVCGRRDAKILYSRFTEAPVRCLIEEYKPLSKAEAAKY
ncbi:MAG: DUF6491 family protein [Asticcacaulis sp.]